MLCDGSVVNLDKNCRCLQPLKFMYYLIRFNNVMKKKKKKKRQHFVPQLHLKHFSNGKKSHGKRNSYVYFYDKQSEIQGKKNITHAAMENYFYGNDFVGQTIENSLSIFESNINKHVYIDLISSEDPIMFEFLGYRGLFAQFVALQFVRTKDHREDIKVMHKLLKAKILEGGKKFADEDLGRQVQEMDSDTFVKEMQLRFFLPENVKYFANIFANKKWVLLINNTPIPFWTSDNPIARFNPFDLDPYSNMGLLSMGIQIYFPLSTKLCLCMLDPEIYRTYNEMERIDLLSIKLNIMQVDTVFINCIMDVLFINSLQVKECYRELYSKFDDFELAKGMVKADPSIKNIENKAEVKVVKDWKPGSDLIIGTNKGHKY